MEVLQTCSNDLWNITHCGYLCHHFLILPLKVCKEKIMFFISFSFASVPHSPNFSTSVPPWKLNFIVKVCEMSNKRSIHLYTLVEPRHRGKWFRFIRCTICLTNVPYSPAFTGMPLYTKPPIFKNGQVVSYISACRTLFGDYGMPYYLKLFRRPCRSIWNSENIMKWPTNWITTGHIGWNLGAYSSFMRLKEEVVTRDKITTKARGGNDRGRGCDVV